MRPTIKQLEYIVAVAEERSISRAAERCRVTQPSLSAQVRQLEARLGAALFERTNRGAIPTELGQAVIRQAHELLEAADRLVDNAAASREPMAGRLRLGSVSTITPYLLPATFRDLCDRFPDARITLRDGTADALKLDLERGDLDALVVPLPTKNAGFDEVELVSDPFLIAVNERTELAELQGPIAASRLKGEHLILLNEPHCIRGQALALCDEVGALPDLDMRATSLAAAMQLVRHGLGITLIPAIAASGEMATAPEVALKRIAPPTPARSIGLAWRRGSPRSGEFGLLASLLMEKADALLARWES